LYRKHAIFVGVDVDDAAVGKNFTAHIPYLIRHRFPHLPGTKLRIEELLDQGCFGFLLRKVGGLRKHPPQEMGNAFLNRKAFDALLAPFGADLRARNAPNLFRVRLKESPIQLPPETIDEEVFQGPDILKREQRASHITAPRPKCPHKAQLEQCVWSQADWI